MRKLTSEERALLDERREGLEEFLEERMPVLAHFMEVLKLPNPPMVLVEAEKYLPALDMWLSKQVITPESEVWLATRLAYFIGEYLVQKHDGDWDLNEIPDSRYFARYVVCDFANASNPNAMVDPFHVADLCMSEPPGRSLMALLLSVDEEILQA